MQNVFDKITFSGFDHTYSLDGKKLQSVTKFLKQFQPEVDFEAIAQRSAEKRSEKEGRNVPVYAIKQEWAASRNKGDMIHANIAKILNNGFEEDQMAMFSTKHPEQESWEKWYRQFLRTSKMRPKHVEWVVGDTELGLAGTVDAAFGLNNRLAFTDWKTGNLKLTAYNDEKMLSPFDDLPNCNFIHYSLQISAYKLIVERNTDYVVPKMFIPHLTPGGVVIHNARDFSARIKEVILG